jgi:hypothetical protein
MNLGGIRVVQICCDELEPGDVGIVRAPEALGSIGDACGWLMWSMEEDRAHWDGGDEQTGGAMKVRKHQ